MRCHELAAAVDVPDSATTVNGPAIDVGRLQAPFLPGYSAAVIMALRAAANAAIRLQGTDAIPERTLEEGESVGSTDDGDGDFAGPLGNTNVIPGTVVITIDDEEITDDGAGTLTGDAEENPATGTINYVTGEIDITGASTEESITADYEYLEFGDTWDDLAEHEVTSANSSLRFTEVAQLPQWVRVQVETSGATGAGAFGAYLIGN